MVLAISDLSEPGSFLKTGYDHFLGKVFCRRFTSPACTYDLVEALSRVRVRDHIIEEIQSLVSKLESMTLDNLILILDGVMPPNLYASNREFQLSPLTKKLSSFLALGKELICT